MMHFGTLKNSLLLLLLVAGPVLGDVPPPEDSSRGPQPLPVPIAGTPVEASVRVVKDLRQKTTRIKIPASVLAKLHAATNEKVSQATPLETNANRTVIAGLSLAMAAACGFVLLSRKIPKGANVAAITFLVLSLVVAGGAIADLRVPGKPYKRPQQPSAVRMLSQKSDKVIIEVTGKGEAVEVILGNDARWAK